MICSSVDKCLAVGLKDPSFPGREFSKISFEDEMNQMEKNKDNKKNNNYNNNSSNSLVFGRWLQTKIWKNFRRYSDQ